MINAYGVYEIKVIDSQTNEVKQTIIKKNKLSMVAVFAISSGATLTSNYTGTDNRGHLLQSYSKRVKPERIFIKNGEQQLVTQYFNKQSTSNYRNTNPILITFYRRFNPPASNQSHSSFYLYNPNDGLYIPQFPNTPTNIKPYATNQWYGNYPLSYINLDTPCIQTTIDYLDVTYKLAIGYSTSIVDKPNIAPQYNKHLAMATSTNRHSVAGMALREMEFYGISASSSFFYGYNYSTYNYSDRYYRYITGLPCNTANLRLSNQVTIRSHAFQGLGDTHLISTTAFNFLDYLTIKLFSTTLAKSSHIGQVINGIMSAYPSARSNVLASTFTPLNITKAHSPVFKHAYGCNGPFQDLNYLGTSTGNITVNSTNYTKKDKVPVFRRIDLKNNGTIGTSKYSYKDFDFCALSSLDGNYSNTAGYFNLASNNNVSDYVTEGFYTKSNPTLPGLANAYAFGVSGHVIPEWNNNIDDSDTYVRTSFTRTDGLYVLSKRNMWSGEVIYSTDNANLNNLFNVKQTAFNTSTKEFWVASSTNGLWKISSDFSTANQIDLSSYGVSSNQVYGITIVSATGVVFCLANGGLLKSMDGGVTWVKYNELSSPTFTVTELNGVGGDYSKGSLVSSDLYDSEILIKLSGTAQKLYKWNTSTGVLSTYYTAATSYYYQEVQFTSKKLPNIALTVEEDLVIIFITTGQSTSTSNGYVYINKLSDTISNYICANIATTFYNLSTTGNSSGNYNTTVSITYTVLPIKLLNNIQYYIGIEGGYYDNPQTGYVLYSPVSNTMTRDNTYPTVLCSGFGYDSTYSVGGFGGTITPIKLGLASNLKLYNHKTKLGIFSNVDRFYYNTWDTGCRYVNMYMASPQVLPGLYILYTPTTAKVSGAAVPITMTNGLPRNIGRFTAWREYMWNGSTWVMDEWAPAVDSSGKGNNGTRKFFDHGYHIFNSSSTIYKTFSTPVTGTFRTVAMTIKTDKYSNSTFYGIPLFSVRNSLSRYKTGRDNTAFSIYWSNGTTPNIATRIGDTFVNSSITTTTYATNTEHRFVFVTESTTTKVYTNGSLIANITHGAQTHNMYEFMVGSMWTLENPVEFFEGTISNIQVWNAELTLDDVFYDYNNQNGIASDNVGNTLLTSASLQLHWKLNEDLEALELKTVHSSARTITNDGATIAFTNGVSGTSFVDKESMTFATLGGILKDNATTVTLPDIYQNFTRDEDEAYYYTPQVPSVSYQVTQLPIYWSIGTNYSFNQVVGPQGAATTASPTTSYSQLDFEGDFDFTFEPSCEEYYDTRVGFTNLTPTDKVYVRFTTSNTEINISGSTTTAAVHTFGDIYRITRIGSNITVFRGATQIATGTADADPWRAFVKFAHTNDAYAGISNAIATMYVPAGLVLFGDKLLQKGIWVDKDYNYSPEYYNLSTHAVTVNSVLTTPAASGSTQYTDKISTIAALATSGSPRVCKYGMYFHSSDYGKTLGGTYRYRYIGI